MKASTNFFALILLAAGFPLLLSAQAGTLDPTFGSNGRAFAPFPAFGYGNGGRLVQHANGRIGVVGTANDAYFAAQFLENGTPDAAFGTNGTAAGTPIPDRFEDLTYALALPNGKTLIVINSYDDIVDGTKLVQLDATGALDATFGQGGILELDLSPDAEEYLLSGAVLPDGKILLAGYVEDPQTGFFTGVVVRFNANGSYDTSFNGTGRFNAPALLLFSAFTTLTVLPDNKILLGGLTVDFASQSLIGLTLRLNAGGTLDLTYGLAGVARLNNATDKISLISDMVRTADGKFIACGTISTFDALRIVRLNANGSLDNTFGTAGVMLLTPSNLLDFGEPRLKLQSDGKIVVCAYAVFEVDGDFDGGYLLASLNADGTLNTAFGDQGIVASGGFFYGIDVAIQPDGKILVGGNLDDADLPGLFVDRYLSEGVATKDRHLSLTEVRVFPNPVRADAQLAFDLPEAKRLQVELVDATGRLCAVLSPMRHWDAGPNALQMTFPSVPTGNYRVRITDEAGRTQAVSVVVVE